MKFLLFPIYFITHLFSIKEKFIESNAFFFNWIVLFSIIVFILHCVKLRKKNNFNMFDKMFFVLFLSTIICSYKCILNISFNSYGTYFFPLLAICISIYLINYSTTRKRIKIKVIIAIFMSVISILYCFSNIERSSIVFSQEKLKTEKGVLAPEKEQIVTIYETVRYLINNTSMDDTILVLPEGAIINFLTDRISNNKFYYLIPPNIEIFQEEKIKNELENNLPDYIVIQPVSYYNFDETFFCESFGKRICSIIPEYYENIRTFGKEFQIAVYKIKNKK